MNLDYYEVLGVSEDACMQDIKNAYRRRAFECHPDHGGAHEKMLLINEAREVLSDPYTRMHYDYARSNQYDYAAQRVAAEEKERARTRAQDYPRKWNDFEAWLDCFICDFTEAEHIYPAQKPNRVFLGNYPTVKNSISGKLFCFFGAVAGFIAYCCICEFLENVLKSSAAAQQFRSLARIILVFSLPPLCACLGCALHEKIGRSLKHGNLKDRE